MRKLSRREAIGEFGRQDKPITREIRRRIRDQQDREQRLVRAMEAFAGMGTIVIDRDQAH
jgi:hypothetical protein